MLIKLAPGQNYWMLLHPADNSLIYYLSSSAPGPIKVDFDKLDPDNQVAIKSGLRYHLIQEAAAEELQASNGVEAQPATQVSSIETQVRNLLQLSISAFQRQMPNLLRQDNALAVLDLVVELESKGENANGVPRKTMINMLERVMADIGGVTEIKDSVAYEINIPFDTSAVQ